MNQPSNNNPTEHWNSATKNTLGRRGKQKNYLWPGTYHITINIMERKQQLLGCIVGDASKPDDDPLAPRVKLSDIGKMVEYELLNSIHAYYPMVEIQDYVIMPDHLHFIVVVHRDIISRSGRETHLGQVIAGFKKGCNRHYWELTGQTLTGVQGEPAQARKASRAANTDRQGEPAQARLRDASPFAVHPQSKRVPSSGSTGRPSLFDYGYVDVMPLKEGQLEQQREYIRNNPRYRLMRRNNPLWLKPQHATVHTALSLPALHGYLLRECQPTQINEEAWNKLQARLQLDGHFIIGDSYGNPQLLNARLLPVVCHRKDAALFDNQKRRCLEAAAEGAILVSAQIAKGERDIMKTAADKGYPVIIVEDNGFPELYHPSEQRMDLCCNNKLLMVTPWQYAYRRVADTITVAECKTMNCIVQALCHTKDSWWKNA